MTVLVLSGCMEAKLEGELTSDEKEIKLGLEATITIILA